MKFEIKFLGYRETADWNHYAWGVRVNGVSFEYKTGIAHRTDFFNKAQRRNQKPERGLTDEETRAWVHIPHADDVLECLFSDAESGKCSFDEFCDNFGYSDDSLKAFDTYRACMEISEKLHKALGKEYQSEHERIQAKRANHG